jgi:hypothetical protein
MWSKKHSAETIERLKNNKSMLGKTHKETTKQKQSVARKKYLKNNQKMKMFHN